MIRDKEWVGNCQNTKIVAESACTTICHWYTDGRGFPRLWVCCRTLYSLAGTVLSKIIVSSVVPKGTQCKMFCFLSTKSLLSQWAWQNPSLKLNLLVEWNWILVSFNLPVQTVSSYSNAHCVKLMLVWTTGVALTVSEHAHAYFCFYIFCAFSRAVLSTLHFQLQNWPFHFSCEGRMVLRCQGDLTKHFKSPLFLHFCQFCHRLVR